jgi:hypothetical protein
MSIQVFHKDRPSSALVDRAPLILHFLRPPALISLSEPPHD